MNDAFPAGTKRNKKLTKRRWTYWTNVTSACWRQRDIA